MTPAPPRCDRHLCQPLYVKQRRPHRISVVFFLNDPAPTDISPLPPHAPLPISHEDFSNTTDKHSFRSGATYFYIQDNRLLGAYATAVESLGNQGSYSDALNNFMQGQLRQFQ